MTLIEKIFLRQFHSFLAGIQIKAIRIPSGVYSDLEKNNVSESVLFSFNDVALRWIGLDNWTYSLDFEVPEDFLANSFVMLTFDGIDTIANVILNDQILGQTSNMFVRYSFDVKKILAATNQLRLEFTSPVSYAKAINSHMKTKVPPECPPKVYNGECHMNLLRKMQASFAWDWGLAAPSMGIWKNAYLEGYDSIKIRDVVYDLQDVSDDEWILDISVHAETGKKRTMISGIIDFELE